MNVLSDAGLDGARSEGVPYIVLSFSDFSLVLPQTDVYALESGADVVLEPATDGIAGRIRAAGRQWPVVCFGSDFRCMAVVPEENRICVLLKSTEGYLGVLCEAAGPLEREQVRLYPVPPVLLTARSPLLGLILADGFFGCLTSGARLAASVVDRVPQDAAGSGGMKEANG